MPWDSGAIWDHLRATPTRADGAIAYPIVSAAWFQGHAGGVRNGEFAVYAVSSRTFIACAQYDTTQGIVAWHIDSRSIPLYVPRVKDASLVANGVRLGSTVSQVRSVYGYAPLQPFHSGTVAKYVRVYPLPHFLSPFTVMTAFFFRGGRVDGIFRIAGF